MSASEAHNTSNTSSNRTFTICLYLICITCICDAQTIVIDSLKKQLPTLKGKEKIECLNELGFEYSNPYWSRSKHIVTDTARYYTDMALRESQKISYEPGLGKAYQNLGMIEEEYGHYNCSEYYTKLSIPILRKYGRQKELHRALINLGFCYHNQGFFEKARNIYEEELKYYFDVNDMIHIPMIYRMIAHSYESQGQIRNAFEAYHKDFEIEKKSDDIINALYSPSNKASLYLAAGDTANAIINYRLSALNKGGMHMRPEYYYSRIAKVYRLQKMEDSAIHYLQTNIDVINSFYVDSNARKKAFASNAIELADMLRIKKNYDSSLYFAHYARKIFEEGNDMENWMTVTEIIAKTYQQIPDNKLALLYAEKLKNKAESLKALPMLLKSYQLLLKHFSRTKSPKATEYKEKFNALSNSLSNHAYISRIATIDLLSRMKIREDSITSRFRLDQAMEKEKISRLAKENKLQKVIFLLVLIIFLLVIGIIIRNMRNKRRKDQLLRKMYESTILLEKKQIEQEISNLQLQKAELEMKALKAQMNPHFISNSLNAINLFILRNDKEQASFYLTKFARLIRTILRHSESSLVELKFELETLHIYLELEKLRFGDHFEFTIQVDPEIDACNILIPPLLLQPYVENAVWHGLMPKEEKGHLRVELFREKSSLVCRITDDGIGRKNAQLQKQRNESSKEAMGIKITTERIALMKINGQDIPHVTINDLATPDQTPAGTEVILKIPISYA